MKTLDEVIKAVDYCRFSSDCNPCPYKEDKECSRAKMTDALHYLKEYRKLDSLDAVAFSEDDNPPLTWDELKQMEGKPVWLEYGADFQMKHWVILPEFQCSYRHDRHSRDLIVFGVVWFLKEDLGKTWQAYRKERS